MLKRFATASSVRRTVLASMLWLFFLPSQVYANLYEGPIADAHAHLPKFVSAESLASIYRQAGVQKAVIFVNIFDGSKLKRIQEKLGEGFLLFPDVHKGKRGRYRLDKKRLDRLEQLHRQGIIEGVGEVYISLSYAPFASNGIETDIRAADEIAFFEKADQLGIPVHLHHETPDDDFDKTLDRYSNVRFILAHSGYLKPSELDRLLTRHSNLYADLSLISNEHFGPFRKAPLVDRPPSLDWRRLLIKHSDRFMVGSDIGANRERVNKLPAVIADYRELLGYLPDKVARKIGYQNFERVFGR